jgi:predicted nucleic acid-binding protein
MILVDTNIIVRLLAKNNLEQYSQSLRFFQQIENKKIIGVIIPEVIPEVIYVMTSKIIGYNMDRIELCQRLTLLLSFQNLKLLSKDIHFEAFEIYKSSKLDYIDCLLIANSNKNNDQIYSFDKELDKFTNSRIQF